MTNTDQDSQEYLDFVKKFEEKKTTDDCYTPPKVYDAVADYVAEYYHLDRKNFIRPFYPGGDYENEEYAPDCVVVDNPPFSMLSKICYFYEERGIKYFLFAQTLTLFSTGSGKLKYAPVNASIIYDNGARINTSFVTNLGEYKIDTLPGLWGRIEEAQGNTKKKLPKYQYPPEVLIATGRVRDFSRLNISFQEAPEDAVFIRRLDSQKEKRKEIYGTGFLLSRKAAETKAKAEAEAEARDEKTIEWSLSDREKEIIKHMEG